MLDEILSDENIAKAKKRVYANKGASGIDGVTVQELDQYMEKNWQSIKQKIHERTYKPQPVLRVEIPKPNGGVRKLGIPTVVDRTIEQAIVQIISPIFEPTFSENSYGFRPGRSAGQAIEKVLELRKYLQAGVMVNGKYEETKLGTPQGGNLSPLLSNVMLNELDKELERRGLNYARYADDCVVLVRSEASAKRVMYSITEWIEKKLGLKVNATKTHVSRPSKVKYLGYSFFKDKEGWKARPHEDSLKKFKAKLKELCKRSWSIDLTTRIQKINSLTRGWINYFALASMKSAMQKVDEHLRTQLRIIIWKQWKTSSKRCWGLRKLGVEEWRARKAACFRGYMKAVQLPQVKGGISKEKLTRRGLVSPLDYYAERHALKLN